MSRLVFDSFRSEGNCASDDALDFFFFSSAVFLQCDIKAFYTKALLLNVFEALCLTTISRHIQSSIA